MVANDKTVVCGNDIRTDTRVAGTSCCCDAGAVLGEVEVCEAFGDGAIVSGEEDVAGVVAVAPGEVNRGGVLWSRVTYQWSPLSVVPETVVQSPG